MNEYDYFIRSKWPGRVEHPKVIGEKFLATLDRLEKLDPVFCGWQIIEKEAEYFTPLKKVEKKFTEIVKGNVVRDDMGDADPDSGYWVFGTNDINRTPKSVSFSTTAGGKYKGESRFEIGGFRAVPDPASVTYPVFRAALLEINAIWSPGWANACAFKMGYYESPTAAGCPLLPYSMFHMAWLSYLSAPFAEGLNLPREIQTERTPDGGILMIAAEERLDPTNPEHMRRSKIIAETMIARLGADGRKLLG